MRLGHAATEGPEGLGKDVDVIVSEVGRHWRGRCDSVYVFSGHSGYWVDQMWYKMGVLAKLE